MRYTRRGIDGEGPDLPKVCIIVPTPQYEDARAPNGGRVLSGEHGRFLNWALGKSGMFRHQVWVTSWVSEPGSAIEFDSKKAEFTDEAMREIDYLMDRGCKVFVPMGKAKELFGIQGNLDKLRGSVFEFQYAYVVPTYEPWQVYPKGKVNRSNDKANMKAVWIADLTKAHDVAQDGFRPPAEYFELAPTYEQVVDWLREARDEGDMLAVDIETTGFNRDTAEVVMIGLARNAEEAMCVPFLRKGGKPYWQNGDARKVKQALSWALATTPLIFQNALFDVPFLNARGFEIPWDCVKHDTMLLHHALHPELPHDLGFIVSVYGNTPYWKEQVMGRLGSVLELDETESRTYNLRDCVVLHQVLPDMLRDMHELGLEAPYAENMSLLEPVATMMRNGIRIDQAYLQTWVRESSKKHAKLEKELRELAQVPEAFNFASADDRRLLFYGQEPPKFKRLAELDEYEVEGTRKRKDTKKYRELMALAELRTVTPIYLPPGYVPPQTQNETDSVDRQALLSLQVHTQNRIESRLNLVRPDMEEVAAGRRLLQFIDAYRQWGELTKLLQFPKKYKPGMDGRIHPSFLIHGTSTGRLSCSNPNLQQIPKRNKDLRRGFVTDPGHVFVSADFQNLEVHILAYETGDRELIRMIQEGINIHDENAKILFQIDAEHPQWASARGAAKIFMFGGISYGGSDRSIHQKVILAAPQLNLTFRAFQEAKLRWMEKHSGYALWRDAIIQEAQENRCVRTFAGRTRYLTGDDSEIRRQALNTPIQGGAGNVFNKAFVDVSMEIQSQNLPYRTVLAVHDQIILEVPDGRQAHAAQLLRTCMQQPFDFHGIERHFVADVEIGPNLGDLKEF